MTASGNKRWRPALRSMKRWLPAVARTTGIVVLTIIIVTVVFRATAPFLISSGLVRSGIEEALSRWTGYRAEIEGSPAIDFWPTPRVTLNQVTIRERAAGGKVLGHVDSLSADFSLLAALRGKADFHEFHFLRPVVYVRRDDTGLIDWTNAGLLGKAIDRVERSPTGSTVITKSQDAKIGGVTVEDGVVELTDDKTGRLFRLDGVNADISWPRLSKPMSAVLLARLNGQDIKVDFFSEQPLLLFAGKNVDAKTTFSSPLIRGTFTGITNMSDFSALSGNLDLAIPDMPSFLAWSGERLPGSATLKNLSMNADVLTVTDGIRFNNLNFVLNDAAASGVMDYGYTSTGKPKISGTLAFDKMNLNPFLAAFSMRLAASTAIDTLLNGNPLQRLDLDLRLSAKSASLGPFNFDNIGAGLLVAGGTAKFDIGDSGFEGGDLTAHLEVTERNFDGGGKLQISIRDADFASLITRLNLQGPLPLANGSLDLSLMTNKPIWAANLGDVAGKLRYWSKAGAFRQFNVSTFRALAAQKKFFRLSDVADSTFDFQTIDLDASFAKGSVDVQNARIVGRNETLSLSGIVPFRTNSLALSGVLDATNAAEGTDLPVLPFFIGGTWPDAIVSPVSPVQQKATQP
ncbi:AsmA family protein [Rhizobium tumorigenes]|uniref:AsmA-like C-terminal region-containing protein n=1 Tax=Rhizobium tumorigenes TaxID=2041385 RepID=A0AAF1K6R3_9HYPH|nr:AsmA-like C-terminal region-containing protein [Rhizobium tumorigenes]WFR95851.1 AsmA-like C-terminal region-containing protein [Rhizobium tumorigenes]